MHITEHAQQRCAQRQINPETFAFIKKHGQKIHRTGITFFFLGKRNIPTSMKRQDRFARLEGITLLVSADGTLITTYRNRKGLKDILKKSKYRLGSCVWPQKNDRL